jgi:hypothetical protein
MNTLDMQTREKLNKLHLEEMHQDARNHQLVRDLKGTRISDIIKVRVRLLMIALVLILLVAFLFSVAIFL